MPRLEVFNGSEFVPIDLADADCFGSEFLDWLKPESLDPTETTDDRGLAIDALPQDASPEPISEADAERFLNESLNGSID